MSNKYMKNARYEVLENKNGDCFIKDIVQNKYFFCPQNFLSQKGIFSDIKIEKAGVKDVIFMLLAATSVFLGIYLFYHYREIYYPVKFTPNMYWLSTGFLLLNLVFHELGHFLVLKIWGRKIGKVRFRLNFIFPAISIDTSDSYILTRSRKFFVYYAGIMVNIFICSFILLFFKQEAYLIRTVLWAILINLIPIGYLKSDGYHIWINTILNVQDRKQDKSWISIVSNYIFITLSSAFLLFSIIQCF